MNEVKTDDFAEDYRMGDAAVQVLKKRPSAAATRFFLNIS